MIAIPAPDYGTRYLLWKEFILHATEMYLPSPAELTNLSRISDSYTTGAIARSVLQVRRFSYRNDRRPDDSRSAIHGLVKKKNRRRTKNGRAKNGTRCRLSTLTVGSAYCGHHFRLLVSTITVDHCNDFVDWPNVSYGFWLEWSQICIEQKDLLQIRTEYLFTIITEVIIGD